MASIFPNDGRVTSIPDYVEDLEAASRRSTDWLDDPVASLQIEIEERSAVRMPSEVYRSAMKWLGRKHERGAMIAVSRWASTQDNWPIDARIACRNNLVDALLTPLGGDAESREAVDQLYRVVDLATDDAVAVSGAIRLARLLNKLNRFDEADQVIRDMAKRVKGSRRWETIVLTTQIESLLERRDKAGAKAVIEALTKSHPEYGFRERFDSAFTPTREEESR